MRIDILSLFPAMFAGPFGESITKRAVARGLLDIHIMNFILEDLGCRTQIYYDQDYEFEGSKTAMLVDMCRKLNCDTYLSNLGSSAYVQIPEFTGAGLNHRYIDYKGVTYRQQFGGFYRW